MPNPGPLDVLAVHHSSDGGPQPSGRQSRGRRVAGKSINPTTVAHADLHLGMPPEKESPGCVRWSRRPDHQALPRRLDDGGPDHLNLVDPQKAFDSRQEPSD